LPKTSCGGAEWIHEKTRPTGFAYATAPDRPLRFFIKYCWE
jgi:hypothetical protein